MAGDEVVPVLYRSGSLFLMRVVPYGVLIRGNGSTTPPTLWGSLLAHTHVVDPWESVSLDDDDLPEAVVLALTSVQSEEASE